MKSRFPTDSILFPLALACALPLVAQENAKTSPQGPTVEKMLQQHDADQDVQLVKSEVDGLMDRYFDRNDLNSDGVIDKEELKDLESRLAMRNQQQPKKSIGDQSEQPALACQGS
ncbi:MAG: hypothetical protein AAF357_18135 [Verrucomicrobiota bacterium]